MGPKQTITRMTPADRDAAREALRGQGFASETCFPKCAMGYSGPALQWISYKKTKGGGVLRICQGEAGTMRTGMDRGVPVPSGCELSKVSVSITILQVSSEAGSEH